MGCPHLGLVSSPRRRSPGIERERAWKNAVENFDNMQMHLTLILRRGGGRGRTGKGKGHILGEHVLKFCITWRLSFRPGEHGKF